MYIVLVILFLYTTHYLSPRWDMWESDEVREDNEYYDYFEDDIFDTLLDLKDDINTLNLTENTPDIVDEYNTVVGESVLRQQEDPKEALEESADKVRSNQD